MSDMENLFCDKGLVLWFAAAHQNCDQLCMLKVFYEPTPHKLTIKYNQLIFTSSVTRHHTSELQLFKVLSSSA